MNSTTKMHVTPFEPLGNVLPNRLIEASREVLRELILAPSVQIMDIDVELLRSARFDSEEPKSCYVVTVSTNDASLLRGAVAAYKGSYKERLEAVLDRIVKERDPQASAHVDIAGPESRAIDRLVPIRAFVESGKLLGGAPIVRAAKENGIDYIQIRGRHFVAPSPAIAAFLEEYSRRYGTSTRRVADLFAGTAVATKVLLRVGRPETVVVIDNDPQKIRKIREHVHDKRVEILQTDALTFSFTDEYDLAIADPYYEDVGGFLSAQLENLRRSVRVLLLVPGNVEDHVWNNTVRQRLERAQYDVIAHELYGQVVFEAKTRTA